MARLRRSSRLGGDPPGDTGAPAFATAVYRPVVSLSSSGILQKSQDDITAEKVQTTSRPRTKRRRPRSTWERCQAYVVRHTWLIPLLLVLVTLSGYLVNPSESNPLHAAIFLSYPLPRKSPNTPKMYGKGARDFTFVAFYTIVFSFTREFLMQRVIRPWGLRYGIRSRGKMSRFMEQTYTAMYFTIFGPYGLYIMSRLPLWYFNTSAMFEGFPHREHDGLFKAYYLLQASYWAQQAIVLVLQLEKPRKDFKELVGHHIVTLALIWLSYRFHFTYMGLAVYITHDVSDFFLASSRALNYLDSVLAGPYYATFVLIWIYLRHYLNIRILWAVMTEFATIGPYELDWETQQYKCWISQIITFSLLAFLQVLNLFWLFFLLRILWRYVLTSVKKDELSDDEDVDEEIKDVSGEEIINNEDIPEKHDMEADIQLQKQR